MTAILYDTLRLSRTLREKGHFTPEQAETLAEALGEASQDNLATKADIAGLKTDITALKTETKADIAALKTDIVKLEVKIEAARAEIVRWVFGAVGFQTLVTIGAILAMVKVLGH